MLDATVDELRCVSEFVASACHAFSVGCPFGDFHARTLNSGFRTCERARTEITEVPRQRNVSTQSDACDTLKGWHLVDYALTYCEGYHDVFKFLIAAGVEWKSREQKAIAKAEQTHELITTPTHANRNAHRKTAKHHNNARTPNSKKANTLTATRQCNRRKSLAIDSITLIGVLLETIQEQLVNFISSPDELLNPLYDSLLNLIHSSQPLHADDTVMAPVHTPTHISTPRRTTPVSTSTCTPTPTHSHDPNAIISLLLSFVKEVLEYSILQILPFPSVEWALLFTGRLVGVLCQEFSCSRTGLCELEDKNNHRNKNMHNHEERLDEYFHTQAQSHRIHSSTADGVVPSYTIPTTESLPRKRRHVDNHVSECRDGGAESGMSVDGACDCCLRVSDSGVNDLETDASWCGIINRLVMISKLCYSIEITEQSQPDHLRVLSKGLGEDITTSLLDTYTDAHIMPHQQNRKVDEDNTLTKHIQHANEEKGNGEKISNNSNKISAILNARKSVIGGRTIDLNVLEMECISSCVEWMLESPGLYEIVASAIVRRIENCLSESLRVGTVGTNNTFGGAWSHQSKYKKDSSCKLDDRLDIERSTCSSEAHIQIPEGIVLALDMYALAYPSETRALWRCMNILTDASGIGLNTWGEINLSMDGHEDLGGGAFYNGTRYGNHTYDTHAHESHTTSASTSHKHDRSASEFLTISSPPLKRFSSASVHLWLAMVSPVLERLFTNVVNNLYVRHQCYPGGMGRDAESSSCSNAFQHPLMHSHSNTQSHSPPHAHTDDDEQSHDSRMYDSSSTRTVPTYCTHPMRFYEHVSLSPLELIQRLDENVECMFCVEIVHLCESLLAVFDKDSQISEHDVCCCGARQLKLQAVLSCTPSSEYTSTRTPPSKYVDVLDYTNTHTSAQPASQCCWSTPEAKPNMRWSTFSQSKSSQTQHCTLGEYDHESGTSSESWRCCCAIRTSPFKVGSMHPRPKILWTSLAMAGLDVLIQRLSARMQSRFVDVYITIYEA
eukprot:CFRG6239T1